MPDFQGYLFNDAGTAVGSASVAIFTRATAADETTAAALATATTTTNSAGLWTSSSVAEGTYDVRITSGSSVRWRRYQDSVQYTTAEVANLRIRTPNASFVYSFVVGNIGANYNITIPTITGNDTLAVLGLAQTYTTARTISVANTAALAVGPNGNTNPMFRVVTNTASAATGVAITGAAAGSRAALAALSSGANEGLDIDALGSGTIRLGGTSTGNLVLNRACNVQGSWVADAAWTIPAVTLGGTVTLNGQTLSGTAAGTPTFSGTVAYTAASPFSVANGQTLTVSTTAQTIGAATLTVPNFAGAADTFAFITLAQTLSNKTLSAPTFSGAYSFGGTPTFGATMAGASTFSGAITLSAAGTALSVTNNFGIGVTTASADLHISRSVDTSDILLDAYGAGQGNTITGRLAGGTSGAPTATAANETLLTINGNGYGTAFTGNRASIQYFAAETFSGTAQGTYITLNTTPTGSTAMAERVRITAAGNVGIGTTTPGTVGGDGGTFTALNVHNASASAYGLLTLSGPTTSDGSGGGVFVFGSTGAASADKRYATIAGVSDGSSSVSTNGRITFATNNAGTLSERVRIDRTGNVGIGTTTPGGTLDIRRTAVTNANPATTPFLVLSSNTVGITAGDKVNLVFRQNNDGAYMASIRAEAQTTANEASKIVFATNDGTVGGDRVTILGNGNVGIGTASFGTGATINLALGGGATSPVIGAATADIVHLAPVDFAAGDRRLYVQSETGSNIIIGADTARATWPTQATADATVDLGSVSGTTYSLVRITSSLEYKRIVGPFPIDAKAIYSLTFPQWESLASDKGKRGYSPIAEYAYAAHPSFAQIDTEGKPVGINWPHLNTAMLVEIQSHERRLNIIEDDSWLKTQVRQAMTDSDFKKWLQYEIQGDHHAN